MLVSYDFEKHLHYLKELNTFFFIKIKSQVVKKILVHILIILTKAFKSIFKVKVSFMNILIVKS